MSSKRTSKWTIIGCIILGIIVSLMPVGLLYYAFVSAKVEVNTNITKYNDYLGPNAKKEYQSKWKIDESIFPSKITSNMNVLDYKMVYYDPWDAQFLSYLVVKYDSEDYQNEIGRLLNYNSSIKYDYYSVTGFSKYHLLAINADSYYGFVYALTNDIDTIIYVEILFCNYYMDLEYRDYINNDYLPDGFDAAINNQYSKEMIGGRDLW